MKLKRFQYTFTNGIPLEEQRAAFERYVVPESRRVAPSALTQAGAIDFTKEHPPLLLIAGSNDHLIPASLSRSIYNRCKRSPSITDFKEFAGRTHFIIAQEDWQEEADYVAEWLKVKGVENARAQWHWARVAPRTQLKSPSSVRPRGSVLSSLLLPYQRLIPSQ